jgi:hypothetical protein
VIEAYLGEEDEEYGLSIDELAAQAETEQATQEREGEDNG